MIKLTTNQESELNRLQDLLGDELTVKGITVKTDKIDGVKEVIVAVSFQNKEYHILPTGKSVPKNN